MRDRGKEVEQCEVKPNWNKRVRYMSHKIVVFNIYMG